MFWKELKGNKVNLPPCRLCLGVLSPLLNPHSLMYSRLTFTFGTSLYPLHGWDHRGVWPCLALCGDGEHVWIPCESPHFQYCSLNLGAKSTHTCFQNLLLPEWHQLSKLNSDCKALTFLLFLYTISSLCPSYLLRLEHLFWQFSQLSKFFFLLGSLPGAQTHPDA